MTKPLRAVVIGAGWAGEGHTRALQHVGVDVVAICARNREVVRAVAERLGVAQASVDWRRTLDRLEPDIVALATPASLRGDVIEVAAARSIHLYCDKPLAPTAAEAHRLWQLAERAGIKHAYAATHCYAPGVAWLGELVRDGAIGEVGEIVMTARLNYPRLTPWSWVHTLAAGGGFLNNTLPHALGILERITGGRIIRATGHARVLVDRAPVVSDIHDFRALVATGAQLTPDQAAGLAWRPADADTAFVGLLLLRAAGGEIPVTIAVGPGVEVPDEANGIRLYGTGGTLIGRGVFTYDVARLQAGQERPEPLPVPQRLVDDLPQAGDDLEARWAALARELVADIRGEPHRPYLTFRDGWRYQHVIDAIRAGPPVEIGPEGPAA